MKWQIPQSVQKSSAYNNLLKLQTNIMQVAIEKRHDFLDRYFYQFKKRRVNN